MVELKFEIVEAVGVLSVSSSGWTKEINMVSWNGKPPKHEIRDWAPDHEKMGKGITLNPEEWDSLLRIATSVCREQQNGTGASIGGKGGGAVSDD